MTVNSASLGDEKLLCFLHHAIFAEPGWDEDFWRESLSDPAIFILIAEGPEGPSGLISVRSALDEAEILTLGVLREARGQGHAKALLEHAQSQLKKNGVARLFLEVAENNESAIGLYRQTGFAPVGLRKDYYGPGRSAQIMEWRSDLPRGNNAA